MAGRNDLSNRDGAIHAECRPWTEKHAVRCCADSIQHHSMHGHVAGSQCTSALSCAEVHVSAQAFAQPKQRIAQAVHQNLSCAHLPACHDKVAAAVQQNPMGAPLAHTACLARGQRLCHLTELREALGRKFAPGGAHGLREPLCGNTTNSTGTTEAATWTSSTEGCMAGYGVRGLTMSLSLLLTFCPARSRSPPPPPPPPPPRNRAQRWGMSARGCQRGAPTLRTCTRTAWHRLPWASREPALPAVCLSTALRREVVSVSRTPLWYAAPKLGPSKNRFPTRAKA